MLSEKEREERKNKEREEERRKGERDKRERKKGGREREKKRRKATLLEIYNKAESVNPSVKVPHIIFSMVLRN